MKIIYIENGQEKSIIIDADIAKFIKESGPGPGPNPQPTGTLFGTSIYQLLKYPEDKIKWFLGNIKSAGGNATEIFLCFSWDEGWKWSPYKQIGTWNEPGMGTFPMFDLAQWNQMFWDKLYDHFLYPCGVMGIIPVLRIQDICSVKDAVSKRQYPFRSCKQRLIDNTLPGGLWGEAIKPWYSKLNDKLIRMFSDTGCKDFCVVPWNEGDYIPDPGDSEEKIKQIVIDHHRWYVNDLIRAGCPKEKIILNPSRGFDEMRSWGHVMEIHGCNSDVTLNQFVSKFGTDKIFPNGDGPDVNAQGRQGDKPTKREPSFTQAREMGRIIKAKKIWGYCFYNRDVENGSPTSIDRAHFDVLSELVKGYSE